MNKQKENGQVMVLSVLMLGGILLSVSAFAGLLMVYQIKQINDAVNSAKAIFAADAGIEWQTFNFYNSSTPIESPQFLNGATVTSSINFESSTVDIRSQGFSGNVVRALEAIYGQ